MSAWLENSCAPAPALCENWRSCWQDLLFFAKDNFKKLAPSSLWDLWVKKFHTLTLPRVWLKTKITQIHALAKTRNHCFDQYILYHQHSYTNLALLQRKILALGKHVGSKNDERLVWKQLCARNKVFNRLDALHRKPSLSIVFNTSSRTKKYICTLTFTRRLDLHIVRGGLNESLQRINLIIFEFANLWLHALNEGQVYPWVHRWRLILLVHIYTTHYPSAAKLSLR